MSNACVKDYFLINTTSCHNRKETMLRTQFLLLFMPEKAWRELSEKPLRERLVLPLLVYPLLVLAALSVFIRYSYGYIDFPDAVKQSVVAFIKYTACIVTAWVALVFLSKHYYHSVSNRRHIRTFVGCTFTITLLAFIVGNLLPSTFTFVEFAPFYMIWVTYKAKDYMQIPPENTFNFVISASMALLGLPFIWDFIINYILH